MRDKVQKSSGEGVNMKLIKGILLITLVAILLTACRPARVNAETVNRYATQTIKLRQKANGKVLRKVKVNTKLRQIREGKRWAIVRYDGKRYVTLKKYLHERKSPRKYTGADLRHAGAIVWKGCKYTYYTSRILPDPNNNLGVPGKWLDSEGFYRDKWGYIVMGSCTSNRGRIIATPFGMYGKVYDAGGCPSNLFDSYVNW